MAQHTTAKIESGWKILAASVFRLLLAQSIVEKKMPDAFAGRLEK